MASRMTFVMKTLSIERVSSYTSPDRRLIPPRRARRRMAGREIPSMLSWNTLRWRLAPPLPRPLPPLPWPNICVSGFCAGGAGFM